MTRAYRNLKDWAVALETAARALLSERLPGAPDEACGVAVEPCPVHGPACARVVYGMLVDHFTWADESPDDLAERLVATMVPH
jgi:hypothetical protein